jgi:uncharacterized protein YheU (UPF0270 family)
LPFDDAPDEGVIAIPYERLDKATLAAIAEDFVSREGTDYGDIEYSLQDKITQVIEQLRCGEATLLYDPVQQSCHIQLTATLRQFGWQP